MAPSIRTLAIVTGGSAGIGGGHSLRPRACRRNACRCCFAKTFANPKFLEEADRQGIEVQLVRGEDIQKLLERIYASPAQVIERAKAATE